LREGHKVILRKTATGISVKFFWIVKLLWAHANEKTQDIEIDKTTA
jgi:hypothetical protein